MSQGDYLEMAEKAKAGKGAAERQVTETLEKERQEIQAKLAQIPTYDFVGMEVGTKAFGRGKIISQEVEYLTVLVREQEKKFALPGCLIQGFLIPDDQSIVENYKRRQELLKELKALEKMAPPRKRPATETASIMKKTVICLWEQRITSLHIVSARIFL